MPSREQSSANAWASSGIGAEDQRHRASRLNLLTGAIALGNTVYLDRAVSALVEHGHSVDENLLPHLSPLGWDHIALTGDYTWRAIDWPPEGNSGRCALWLCLA